MYNYKEYEIGKEYWSFYLDRTKKGDRLKDYCGVFKVTPIELYETRTFVTYDKQERTWYNYRWEIEGRNKFPYPMNHNITGYINDERVFETREQAIEAHDNKILDYSRNQSTDARTRMHKKLLAANIPSPSEKEVKAIEWFNGLKPEEVEHLKWIKYYYDKI